MENSTLVDTSEVIDNFISQIANTVSRQAVKTYFSRLNAWETWLNGKNKDVVYATKDDMSEFLGHYNKPRTINLTIVVLKIFYSWLVETEVITESPAERLKRLRVIRSIPDPLTEEEIVILLKDCKEAKYRIPILLMLYAGLRVSESLYIRKKHFWTEKGILMFKIKGKGAKERETYITNKLAQKEIEKHIKNLKPDKRLSYIDLNEMERYAMKVCIDKFHLHRLRKTFACSLADNGTPPEQIMLLLGHSDYRTTQIYTRYRLNRNKLKMID